MSHTSTGSRKSESDAGKRSDLENSENGRSDDNFSAEFIYQSLVNAKMSVASIVMSWLDVHAQASEKAVQCICELVCYVAGCNEFRLENVDLDDVSEVVEQIENFVPSGSYPLVINSKKFSTLRGNLRLFLWTFIDKTKNDVLFAGDFLNNFIQYLSSMANSSYRSLRHTAVWIGILYLFVFPALICFFSVLELAVAISKLANSFCEQLDVTQRMIEVEKSSHSSSRLRSLKASAATVSV